MTAAPRYEDPSPADRPMCSRFGAGAFPCGPVFKIRVTANNGGPGRLDVVRRMALCEAHYTFDVTKTGVSGGAGGFKARAKNIAFLRLAASHADEYQGLYAEAVRELSAQCEPPIDPSLLLGPAAPVERPVSGGRAGGES